MIKELITYVVRQLVNNPDDVSIILTESADRNRIEIRVHDADRGKVIGRDGQTIKALRMLVNALTHGEQGIAVDISKQ